jgi:hypothetical protein
MLKNFVKRMSLGLAPGFDLMKMTTFLLILSLFTFRFASLLFYLNNELMTETGCLLTQPRLSMLKGSNSMSQAN